MKRVLFRAVATTAAALVFLAGSGGIGHAAGGPINPVPAPGQEPRNIRCPEPNAPYYLYSFPVLISDDGGDRRAWMGWYYAAGCAFELDARGRAKGKTYANLAVNEGSVDEESDWRRQVTAATLVPIEQALPPSRGIPSDLAALQVPEWNSLTTGFLYLGWRAPLPVAIPSYLAQDMEQVGFQVVPGQIDVLSGASRYIDGNRILIDSSRGTVGASALIDWWDVHGQGEFYNWDPSGAAASNPNLAGGIMRIILRPVDWEARDARQIGTSGNEAEVQVTVRLGYSSKRRQTPVAWRWKGESEWHEIGMADLDPYTEGPKTFRVPLPAQPRTIEIKVNYREDSPPHEVSFANNTAEVTITPPAASPPPPAAACTTLDVGIDIKGSKWIAGDEVPVVFWTIRQGGPSGQVPVRLTVTVGGQSQTRTAQLGAGKGTSGQVLYVAGSPGRLTASLRAEIQGAGAGCRSTWTASDNADVLPPPPDQPPTTPPDTGIRYWDWR